LIAPGHSCRLGSHARVIIFVVYTHRITKWVNLRLALLDPVTLILSIIKVGRIPGFITGQDDLLETSVLVYFACVGGPIAR
jgi:hypothetical protein